MIAFLTSQRKGTQSMWLYVGIKSCSLCTDNTYYIHVYKHKQLWKLGWLISILVSSGISQVTSLLAFLQGIILIQLIAVGSPSRCGCHHFLG